MARVLQEHPPEREVLETGDEIVRGLAVRLKIRIRPEEGEQTDRAGQSGAETSSPTRPVQGLLALGPASRFYPSDAAMARWQALLSQGSARIMYE